jgi:hypothetical protein
LSCACATEAARTRESAPTTKAFLRICSVPRNEWVVLGPESSRAPCSSRQSQAGRHLLSDYERGVPSARCIGGRLTPDRTDVSRPPRRSRGCLRRSIAGFRVKTPGCAWGLCRWGVAEVAWLDHCVNGPLSPWGAFLPVAHWPARLAGQAARKLAVCS